MVQLVISSRPILLEILRCEIKSSSNLQEYPRKAWLSENLGLDISSIRALPRKELDACSCAGAVINLVS